MRPRKNSHPEAVHQSRNSLLVLPPDAIHYYADHCYEYICDCLLAPVWDKMKPSKQQKQLADAICQHERVLADSGHGIGKSVILACIGLWFLDTRPSPCKVPCTAPTGHQLKDVLWSNFSSILGQSLITDDISWMATEVRHKTLPHPHLAMLRTSNKPDNMQGQHAEHLLWIIDEAYGLTNPMLWDVINGSMTESNKVGGDNRMILVGQPTQVTGYCADAKNPKRSPEWKSPKGICLRFNSEESPFVSKDWIAGMAAKWGKTHDIYRVRVLGLPPIGNPKAFISLSEVMTAIGREEVEEGGQFEIGIDPAREGDDLCVLAWRRGCKVYPFETMPKSDEFQIAAMALRRVRKIREEFDFKGRIKVKIENVGGYGAGAVDILRRNKTDNIEVVALTSGGGGNSEYANHTTIMWAELRDSMKRISLPDDDDLVGQLCAREATIDTKTGKDMIEPKKFYKRRMGHSPDKADALILCWTQQAQNIKLIDLSVDKCVAKLQIKWHDLGAMTIPIIGMWTGKDMRTGICMTLWKQESNTLFVIRSGEFDCARPEKILPDMLASMAELSAGVVTKISQFEWFGNDLYDDNGIGTVRSMWQKAGVHVRANMNFSIDGAILRMNKLIEKQSIFFDEQWAGHLPVHLQSWYADKKDEAPEDIMAFCNIISVIHEGTYVPKAAPMAAFSAERADAHKRNEEWLKSGATNNLYLSQESTDWMI